MILCSLHSLHSAGVNHNNESEKSSVLLKTLFETLIFKFFNLSMMTISFPNWTIRLITKRFYRRYRRSLTEINPPLKVEFSEIPGNWINKICWGDLTAVWRKNGIPATGIAGFICGNEDENGCSTLWNPDSPNYLAWCGVYVFKPDRFEDFYDPQSGATEIARNIGYVDDMEWSKIFGNRTPFYEEIHIERLNTPLITAGFQSESYFSTVRCQTYLGPRSLNLKSVLASEVMAELYKRTSDLDVDGEFFRPTRRLCEGHSYENVLRDVWVTRILLPEEGLIYAIYATSVRAEDGSWDYTKLLEPEFKRFFKGVKLTPLVS